MHLFCVGNILDLIFNYIIVVVATDPNCQQREITCFVLICTVYKSIQCSFKIFLLIDFFLFEFHTNNLRELHSVGSRKTATRFAAGSFV